MSVGGEGGHIHPIPTQRSGYRYFFYDKHHGRAGPKVARWALNLGEDEEFGIFNRADELELSDAKGNLYGVRLDPDGQLIALGTLRQQVAKFTDSGPHWHGFPLGPLERSVTSPLPPERPLPKDALQRMVATGLLTNEARKRLSKGKHA